MSRSYFLPWNLIDCSVTALLGRQNGSCGAVDEGFDGGGAAAPAGNEKRAFRWKTLF